MPEWKSVKKDGLPPEGKSVYVTYQCEFGRVVDDDCRYVDGKWQWYDFKWDEWQDITPDCIVLAWMDLEPYKGE